ncbi:MAG: YkgJ family cysteine cluster protein [Phycisphaerales bacterium]|nr:MAG: YkgJ family cysteine cluster protein [Phycisphaerales bacterium]
MRKDYPAITWEGGGDTCSGRKEVVGLELDIHNRKMQFSVGVGNGHMKVVELELDIFGELLHTQIYVKDCSATLDDIVPVARAISSRVVHLVRRQSALKGIRVPCRRGCHSACCYYLILLSIPESLHVANEVKAMRSQQRARIVNSCRAAKQRMQLEIAKFLSYKKSLDLLDVQPTQLWEIGQWYGQLGQACPFLRDSQCTIYEHRPLVCREWLVTGSASQCKSDSATRPRMVKTPLDTSVALIELTAELSRRRREAVPLFCMFDCWDTNLEIRSRVWPAIFLVEKFAGILTRLQKKNAGDLDHVPSRIITERGQRVASWAAKSQSVTS